MRLHVIEKGFYRSTCSGGGEFTEVRVSRKGILEITGVQAVE